MKKTATMCLIFLIALSIYAASRPQKDIKISPGMSVTVEIKTGTRRIIDFFLEPFIKSTDEALKLR